MNSPLIKGPFLSRKASSSLRDQLVTYLRSGTAGVGEPFFSDAHLMKLSGLSRKTVRRALDELQRDGWIERRPGRGSYIGPRVSAPIMSRPSEGARTTVRLAVLAFGMAHNAPDWYSQGVLAGIDDVAVEHAVSIELLGNPDITVLSRRLAQSRPDVLAVLPSTNQHVYAVAEATRVSIPCLLTGTRFLDLGLPTVCEDGTGGAAMAVKHLAERGHRRIGLLHRPDSAPWVFARREGYLKGLIEAGIEPDERLICWVAGERDFAGWAEQIQRYLDLYKPTALLLTSGMLVNAMGELQKHTGLQVPRDLSIISFDQVYSDQLAHVGRKLTTIELPLRQMGRTLGQMAREIVEKKPLQRVISLQCELTDHGSVAAIA
jgi:GntR family transcriptional regulator, arabinose operon transcriptional repressor